MAATPSLHEPPGAVESPRLDPPDAAPDPGLVLCAITVRDLAGGFPTGELVHAAAALQRVADRPSSDRPGLAGEYDREAQRRQGRYVMEVRPGAVVMRAAGGWTKDTARAPARAEIKGWSPRSRSRMVLALGSLDYAPLFALGTPAMVTLTLPGDWLTVAPTARAFKRLFQALLKRIGRAWGPQWLRLVWKEEFQRRGAPHLHLFMAIPTGARGGLPFRAWLSKAWADVVAHPDPEQRRRHELAGTGIDYREGLRARDPKRLAVYFSKHGGAGGGKEYQHQPPAEWIDADGQGEGTGRIWGYRGLQKVCAAVDIPEEDFTAAKRTLRRLSTRETFYGTPGSRWPSAVRPRIRQVRVPRGADPRTGEVRYRTVTRRRKFLAGKGGGFFMTNDGPALASALSRLQAVASG